jgi:hypothetical protein
MATIGSLVVNLIANTTGFSAGLQKGSREAKAFESRMKTLTAGAKSLAGAFGIVGGVAGAGAFLKSSIDEAMEAEKVMTQLETVVKSTGKAAGFSANQLSNFATVLQKTTTFADDTTKAAAATLATFTNIKGVTFLNTIKSAQDLSIAFGQDLNTSVIQLGKALNDPVKGISALTRVGVSFTQQQKDQIKTLVEQNQLFKAQAIILKELKTEFGGSAEAFAKTRAGRMQQLGNKTADLKEEIGIQLGEPVVDASLGGLGALERWGLAINRFINPLGTFAKKCESAGEAIGPVADAMRMATSGIVGLAPVIEATKPRASIVGKLGTQGFEFGLAGAMKRAFTKNTGVSGLLDTAFGSQFIGKNRENLRGVNQSQFDAWSAARKGGGADMRQEYRPLGALRRGSAEAYSEILRAKGNVDVMSIAKEQLATQKQIATNTGKNASTLVTIGSN